MYAVNINDLGKFKNNCVHPVNMLLVPLLSQVVVNCEPGRGDGQAWVVSDGARSQWHTLMYLIRKGSGCYRGVSAYHLRIYCKSGDEWKRI